MLTVPKRLVIVIIMMAASIGALRAQSPSNKGILVRRAGEAPRIDGTIDELWQAADSTDDFVQFFPYEKSAPSERTVVRALQDDENLYVAFTCYAAKHKPIACLTKDEDYIILKIDPFGSKTTGYFFQVFGSKLFYDGMLLDDGRNWDGTWEGVWSRGVAMRDDQWVVELKIPFKSIRYKKGLSRWGVQFVRHIAHNKEEIFWTGFSQQEDDLVSRWATLDGVDPRSSGYYFELYPEGFVRYDDFRGAEAKLKPRGSFTVKWDVTPQTTINATTFPDFAQIETDPFSLNLSRYPRYLQEQRPFFVEGGEIFRFPSFNDMGFFQPLNIFYSRTVGRLMDGEAVAITGGLKTTHRSRSWNAGVLAAGTDDYTDTLSGLREPRRAFGVARYQRTVLGNSDIGVLASGTRIDRANHNYAVGVDGVYRRGGSSLMVQTAASDRNGKRGLAATAGLRAFAGRVLTHAAADVVGDSFDVADIGYVPWAGRQRAIAFSGPFLTFKDGAVRSVYPAVGGTFVKEPGNRTWSRSLYAMVNTNFRQGWGLNLEGSAGKAYELDTSYTSRSLSMNFWGNLNGNNINGGFDYSYGWNYLRGYLGYQGYNRLSCSYSITEPLVVTLGTNLWVEGSPDNHVAALWPMLRPSLLWRLGATMTLTTYNEGVYSAPGTEIGKATLQSNRWGLLYSWNFAPKSWLYVALNDYQEREYDPARSDWRVRPQYFISAVKAKYLLYF